MAQNIQQLMSALQGLGPLQDITTRQIVSSYDDNGPQYANQYYSPTIDNLFGDQAWRASISPLQRQELQGDQMGYVDDPSLGYRLDLDMGGNQLAKYNLGTDGALSFDKYYKTGGGLGGFIDKIGQSLLDVGPAIPLIAAAAANPGFLATLGGGTAGGSAAPISASAVSSLGPAATTADIMSFIGATGAGGAGLGAAAGGGLGSALGTAAQTIAGGASSGMLPALVNAVSQYQQGDTQRDWAERLYQDRSQFLERLAGTYSNPQDYLTSPEYTAIADLELDRLMRKDAAQGRLATDVQRQQLMQQYAMKNLADYRKGLAGAAGLTGTQGLAELDVSGLANIFGMGNAPFAEASRQGYDFSKVLDRVFDLGGWF